MVARGLWAVVVVVGRGVGVGPYALGSGRERLQWARPLGDHKWWASWWASDVGGRGGGCWGLVVSWFGG